MIKLYVAALIFLTLLILNVGKVLLAAVAPSSFIVSLTGTRCDGSNNPFIDLNFPEVNNVTPTGAPLGDRYEVFRSTNPTGPFTYQSPTVLVDNDPLSWTDTTPARGATYYYYVNAVDATAPYPAPYVSTGTYKTTNTLQVATPWCDSEPPTEVISPTPQNCYATLSPASAFLTDFTSSATDVGASGMASVTYTLTNPRGTTKTYTATSGPAWTYPKTQVQADLTALGGTGKTYTLKARACDRAGNCSVDTAPATFDYKTTCLKPFFQTSGGDIHSNQKVAPGGQ